MEVGVDAAPTPSAQLHSAGRLNHMKQKVPGLKSGPLEHEDSLCTSS